MKGRPTLVLGILLFLAGCTTAPVADGSTDPVETGVPKSLEPVALVGTWRGVIPCADCPGINYSLRLNEDNTFEESLTYQERDVEPFTRTGTWRLHAGKVELEAADTGTVPTLFELTRTGELNMLDQEGKPTTTDTAPLYVLRKDSTFAKDNPILWNERRERGLDFVATGNEPGWLLEIDLEQSILFKTLPSESIALETPVPDPVKDGNRTTYAAASEAGELVVEIIQQACEDTMSGKMSPYLVRIRAKGINFKGCGSYLRE